MAKLTEKQYQKRLKQAYKKADKRLKDGSLKLEEYTGYIKGYMKEEAKN